MGRLTGFAVGLGVGVLSGMGIGGGTLLMIWLCVFAGMDRNTAGGINLLYFLPAGAAGLITHLKEGRVSGRAFAFCAPAAVLASALGGLAATCMDGELLKKLFGGALIFVGLGRLMGKRP